MGKGGGPEERATSGKEAHVGFSSLVILRGRPSWPAWMGVQGCWPLCLAWQHDHFKLNGAEAFNTFTVFWDYHLCRVLRRFITPRVTPFPGSSDALSPPPPALAAQPASCLSGFAGPDISHKWIHTVSALCIQHPSLSRLSAAFTVL